MSESRSDRYEAYDPQTGEVVGAWRTSHTAQEVAGFRDEWHPHGGRLLRCRATRMATAANLDTPS